MHINTEEINKRILEILEKCIENNIKIELNEKDYRSLFHIGCDYLVGSSRTGNKVDRNPYLARDYFVKALRLAKASKDSVLYKSMIEPKLKRIEQMNYGK